MRFVIEAPLDEETVPVWNHPAALPFLDRLIARADEAAHEVFLDDADLVDGSEWFLGARAASYDRLQEICELARIAAWRVVPEDSKVWRVSTSAEAERALRIANSRLKLLVENRLRDGALIEVAVRLLANERLRGLWIAPPEPPAIHLMHGGGTGDMEKFMRQEAAEAHQGQIPLRLIVIVDSDRSEPGQPPSDKAVEIESEAQRLGAKSFILSKHEAENYIPDFHWRAEAARDPRNPNWVRKITAALSLATDERDFCDMETLGLKKVDKTSDRTRSYHLEVMLESVRQERDTTALGTMAADLRARDHTGDLTAILALIEQER